MTDSFFSCDWGTTSFRLRLVDMHTGRIIHESAADTGIASVYEQWKKSGLEEKERLPFYLSTIQQHTAIIKAVASTDTENVPVVISGMASSSIGMMELPYATMPFSTNGENLLVRKINKTNSFTHDLVIISGGCTSNDVMRGEETQLTGCTHQYKNGKQLYIFPGTHSKHITVNNGKAVALTTFMTGEFFELLSQKSILAASISNGNEPADMQNKKVFEQGVTDSLQQNLLHQSFMVRTNQLFNRCSKTDNYYYLSGLLIGTELQQVLKMKADTIILVGGQQQLINYTNSLNILGLTENIFTEDAAAATIRGQMVILNDFINADN